jgi:hypothetical protein
LQNVATSSFGEEPTRYKAALGTQQKADHVKAFGKDQLLVKNPKNIRNMKSFGEFYKRGETVHVKFTIVTFFSGVHWAVLNPDNNNKRKLTEELICSTNCPL